MAQVKKFYIGNRKIDIDISPQLSSTLDETLDNLNVKEIANDREKPYAPFQKFYIKDENDNILQTFIISADNVELATVNPNRYIHNLSLVQLSEFLTKHEIRNTVFSNSIETANYYIYMGGRYYFNCDTKEMVVDNNLATIDLSKKTPYRITLKPEGYNCSLYRFYESAELIDNLLLRHQQVFWVDQDYNSKKWSDIYKDNPNNIEYPVIIFKIDVNGVIDSRSWQLDNFAYGENLEIPSSIQEWINSYDEGILTIERQIFTSLTGFTLTPNSDVNCPIYGNLSFEVQIDAIELSVLDAIDTLLKQKMKETDDYNSTNDSANIKPLFLLPTQSQNPNLYNLLKTTNTPNFVFTQCSFYDALAEIFKLFDAIFTIDDDGYLDIEYFNDAAQEEIEEPTLAGKNQSLSEERYTNKLITYFQNTKINHEFPNSNDENATAYVGSKSLGVPGQSDFVFIVPKPIDIIKRIGLKTNTDVKNFYFKLYDIPFQPGDPYTQSMWEKVLFRDVNFNKVVDITQLVFESSLWSLLPATGSANPYTDTPCKENTLSYERGSKYIEIARYYNITSDVDLLNKQIDILTNVYNYALYKMLGISDSNELSRYALGLPTISPYDAKLTISYIALVDGKLVDESIENKYDGETLINQSNGSIDINKLGLNMVGLSLKLGQPTLNVTQLFSSWDNRVKKGQFFIDENNDRWVANNCVYTIIKPDLVQANIEFVKNFNGLAKRIELNNEKRLSNISNELTVKCEETYGEYIYYSSLPLVSLIAEKIALNPDFVANSIAMGFTTTLHERISSNTLDATPYITQVSLGDVVNKTIDTSLNNLYEISCDVRSYDDQTGELIVEDSMYGLSIPLVSDSIGCLVYSAIEGKFIYNDMGVTHLLERGYPIKILLLIDSNREVQFGAIIEYNNVATDVNYEEMLIVYIRNTFKVEYTLITAYKNGKIINNGDSGDVKNIAIPLMVYGSGNSICFEMSFDSPISAGTQLIENNPLWTGGWFNNVVLYTDNEGRVDDFTIDFVRMQDELTRYYPEMKTSPTTYIPTYSFGKLSHFKYYKKPNEIFALNYQLHFMPYDKSKDFLNNEFIKNNGFSKGLNGAVLKIVTSTHENIYSVLDTKGEGTTHDIVSINTALYDTNDAMDFVMIFSIGEWVWWNNIKSWAIVDKNNNIYFASNVPPHNNQELGNGDFAIYFKSRHHRDNI